MTPSTTAELTKKRKVTLGGLLGSKVKTEPPEKPVPEVQDELENYLESLEDDDLELDGRARVVLVEGKGAHVAQPRQDGEAILFTAGIPLPALSACFLRQEKCMMICASQPRIPDRETQRDLALLRAWMDHRGDAEAALAELRERGLDVLGGEDEPWTVRRAQERHEFLCRCVRTFARLLPEGADMRRVCGLMRQCS